MKILEFALMLGKLKKLKRTGWLRNNIQDPESVAEHSFRVAVLTMILAPKVGADPDKALKIALIHDIGEAKIGDIVTQRGTEDLPNLQDKLNAERKALVEILSLINDKDYVQLFDEYEANQTKEAQLVKQIDKLEMAIQAFEYEQQHKINLQEFFDGAGSKVTNKNLREIIDEIMTLRKQ